MVCDFGSANMTSMTFNSHPTNSSILLLVGSPLPELLLWAARTLTQCLGLPRVEWMTHSAVISDPAGLGVRQRGRHLGRQEYPFFVGLVLLGVQQELWKFFSESPIPLPSTLVSPIGQAVSCPLPVSSGRFTQSSRPRADRMGPPLPTDS